MPEYIEKAQIVDWYRCYGQTDEPIPFETLVFDLRSMKAADVAPVVRCRHCYAHGRCGAEKIYLSEGIEDPFCCRGARKDGNGE